MGTSITTLELWQILNLTKANNLAKSLRALSTNSLKSKATSLPDASIENRQYNFMFTLSSNKNHRKQDSRLPSVCVSVAATGCQYWWGGRVRPQVKKFEQVSCYVSSGGGYVPRSHIWRKIPYHVTYQMMHVMLTTPNLWTDRRIWKHYLPTLPLREVQICFRVRPA